MPPAEGGGMEIKMKNVILSADGDSVIYAVPDTVADNLEKFCTEFCGEWLHKSPDAEKYRTKQGVCYNEADFIAYLNQYVFPDQISTLVKNIGWTELGENLPEEYREYPYFNF